MSIDSKVNAVVFWIKSPAAKVKVANVEFCTLVEPAPNVISKFPVAPVNPAVIKSAAEIVITSAAAWPVPIEDTVNADTLVVSPVIVNEAPVPVPVVEDWATVNGPVTAPKA